MKSLQSTLICCAMAVVACNPAQTILPTTDGGTYDCSKTTPADLAQVYDSYFSTSRATGCSASGCHGTGAGGLTFHNEQELWAASVGKPSALIAGAQLIRPGDPAHSVLFQRLNPGGLGRMPQGGPYLDDSAIAQVAGWICAGAPAPTAPLDGGPTDAGPVDGGIAAPQITGVDPPSGVVGTAVTISGSGFAGGAQVAFNGAAATVTSANETSIATAVPDGATTGPITVTVDGQTATSPTAFEVIQPNPVPVVAAVTPSMVTAGGSEIALQIEGSNFVALSTAAFDSQNLPTQFVDAEHLTATLAATNSGLAGSHTLTVTTPGPGGGTSSGLAFVVQNPTPTLVALTPSSVPAGSGDTTVIVQGTGFVAETKALLNGTAFPTTFVSTTEVNVVVPATLLTTGGAVAIAVSTPLIGGGSATSNTIALPVEAESHVPTIIGLTPNSAITGTAGLSVSISGFGFIPESTVAFGGSDITAHYVSATELTIDLGTADLDAAGAFSVVVTNDVLGGGASNAFSFTVVDPNPLPAITSLSPSNASVGAASQLLSVDGTGFVNSSTIAFNGLTKATTFVSSTRLTATLTTADFSTAGTFGVVVTSPAPGGGTSGSSDFTVTNPSPTISSLSPVSVTVGAPARSISVNGAGFVVSSQVSVEGSDRTTHYVNTTLVTADLLANDFTSAGTRSIVVTNPGPGGGVSSAATLTVSPPPNPVPTITSLSPCGTVAGTGGFTLTITGTNFISGSTATFGGTAITLNVVSATQATADIAGSLIATAPATNSKAVVLTNPAPGGGSSSSFGFGLASQAATLAANVQPIFTLNCSTSNCHTGSNAAEGLNLSSGRSYAELVGVNCSQCASRKLVQACGPGPTQSYLVAKIKGTSLCSGSRMPKNGQLTTTEQQTVVDWVAQGAPQ